MIARHLRAGIATALALAVMGLASPAAAPAATMGTPLGTGQFTGAPDSTSDCSQYYSPLVGTIAVVSPSGAGPATSCIWIDSTTFDLATTFAPQAYGISTVTAVRVAVGQITGPMQAAVMRGLYQNTVVPGKPNYACCLFITASAPFTPQANAVTTVNVNLPMNEAPTPPPYDTHTVVANDVLGLAVLEPGVPVPLYDLGDQTTVNFLWDTSMPSSQTPGFWGDTVGFHVAMDADYTSAGTGAPTSSARTTVKGRSQRQDPFTAAGISLATVDGTPPELSGGCRLVALCIATGAGL